MKRAYERCLEYVFKWETSANMDLSLNIKIFMKWNNQSQYVKNIILDTVYTFHISRLI